MTLHERIRKILFRQLENFWDEWDKEVINRQIPEALEQMNKNYSMAASKQRYNFFVQIEPFIVFGGKQ